MTECPTCGRNTGDTRFCGECGTELRSPEGGDANGSTERVPREAAVEQQPDGNWAGGTDQETDEDVEADDGWLPPIVPKAVATLFGSAIALLGVTTAMWGGQLTVVLFAFAAVLTLPQVFHRLPDRIRRRFVGKRRGVLVVGLVVFALFAAPPMYVYDAPADRMLLETDDLPADWEATERTSGTTTASVTFEHASGRTMEMSVRRYDTSQAAADGFQKRVKTVFGPEGNVLTMGIPFAGPSDSASVSGGGFGQSVIVIRNANVVAVFEGDDPTAASEISIGEISSRYQEHIKQFESSDRDALG